MKDDLLKCHKSFFFKETNFGIISEKPFRFECGMDIICTEGEGIVSTGVQSYRLRVNDELIFPSGTILERIKASDNFKVRIFAFSEKMFDEISGVVDSSYFETLKETPLFHHPIGSDSWTNVNLWMDFARMLCSERHNQFIGELERNFLRSYYLWICNIIPAKYFFTGDNISRRRQLYQHFLALVHENSRQEREVTFYADKLSISTRYLNNIVNEFARDKSPKDFIDEQTVAEIKGLLYFSDFAITEIAERLNFPDQSYMSRYFKKHTGYPPRTYRKEKKQNK